MSTEFQERKISRKVVWDHTDPYPQDIAYFFRQVATKDRRQMQLFREWIEDSSLSEFIEPEVDTFGDLIRLSTKSGYEEEKKKRPLSTL